MSRVELAHMTWREAAAARERGAVVLIPVGTHEQNGSVCPLGTDTLIAFEVARRTALETGAVVAPPLSYGYSDRNRSYPGTISLKPDTLRRLILDVCEGMIRDGFDHLLLVNSHQTNHPLMEQAAREIRERYEVLLGYIDPMALVDKAAKDLFPALGSVHGHGDERVASMLLSFLPDSVRVEAAQPEHGWREFEGLPLVGTVGVRVGEAVFGLYMDVHDFSNSGGNGNPAAADAERGAELLRRIVALSCDYVRVFGKLRVTNRK